MDRFRILLTKGDGFPAVVSLQDLIAVDLQGILEQFSEDLFIFHQEDGFRAAQGLLLRGFVLEKFHEIPHRRQVNLEGGSLAGPAGDLDKAAALFDDAIDRGEPQSGAAAHILGGKERFKNVIQSLVVHAQAVIGNPHEDIGAGDEVRLFPGIGLIKSDIGSGDDEFAALGHGVPGVDRQVQDDLFHLAGVSLDDRQHRFEIEKEFDVFTDEAAQHLFQITDDPVEIELLGLQHLLATEGQKLPG